MPLPGGVRGFRVPCMGNPWDHGGGKKREDSHEAMAMWQLKLAGFPDGTCLCGLCRGRDSLVSGNEALAMVLYLRSANVWPLVTFPTIKDGLLKRTAVFQPPPGAFHQE